MVPDPTIGADEVLLSVKATSVNFHDIFTRHGMPGIKIEFPLITGSDVSGQIREVGETIEGWDVGDRVLVDPIKFDEDRPGMIGETSLGGRAELLAVHASQLIRMPDNVSFENAASLPLAIGTAHRMMLTQGAVKAGEKVLVLGASGGVGTGCVQLAKLAGCEVIACASSNEKLERLRAIGADHLINYRENDFRKEIYRICGKPRVVGGGGVDVVVNFTGGDTWVDSLKCLTKGGRLLTCGATAGFEPEDRPPVHLDVRAADHRIQRMDPSGSRRSPAPRFGGIPVSGDRQGLAALGCARSGASARGPRGLRQGGPDSVTQR